MAVENWLERANSCDVTIAMTEDSIETIEMTWLQEEGAKVIKDKRHHRI